MPIFRKWLVGICLGGMSLGGLVAGSKANGTQFTGCAVYLLSARQNHFVDGISQQLTSAALQEINLFRARKLGEFAYTPSVAAVVASSTSSVSERQAVASRVSEILKPKSADDIEGDRQTGRLLEQAIYGTVLVGRANIEAELAFRRALASAAEGVGGRARLKGITCDLTAVSALCLALGVAAFLEKDMSVAGLFGLAGLFYFLRNVPEETYRAIRFWDRRPGDLAPQERNLAEIRAGEWYFRSANIRAPMEVVRNIWFRNTIEDEDFIFFARHYLQARETRRLTGDHLIFLSFVPPLRGQNGWLRVDEVLTFDSALNEPKLITFVRFDKDLPRNSQREPVRKDGTVDLSEPVSVGQR